MLSKGKVKIEDEFLMDSLIFINWKENSCDIHYEITYFLKFKTVRHKNLNKEPVPHVVSIADESIIVSSKPHARTVRPYQWHVTRGGHTVEKEFREGD